MSSPRKLLFYASFVAIPTALWFITVHDMMARRETALEQLANSDALRIQDRSKVQERDRLEEEWNDFKPVADKELHDLENYLNPYLLLHRITLAARKYGFETVVSQAGDDHGPTHDYTILARADYESLVRFVHDLETGPYRVRFEELDLGFPTDPEKRDRGVSLRARFGIPALPTEQAEEQG